MNCIWLPFIWANGKELDLQMLKILLRKYKKKLSNLAYMHILNERYIKYINHCKHLMRLKTLMNDYLLYVKVVFQNNLALWG